MATETIGYLYTVTNDIRRNGVAVLKRAADGSLKEVAGSPFRTGGKGLGGGDIDQQGAIRIHGKYVFAVNPGSDTVAVLRKGTGGKLRLVPDSPFPSGGIAPLSLTIHGDVLYVANQAPPFAKRESTPNITGFRIGRNGKLDPIPNSTIPFPVGQGPAQVDFNPRGDTVVVTSGFQDGARNQLHGYNVQANGTLKEHAGSPLHPKGASGSVGFSWNPEGNRVYVSNFRRSAITVFDVDRRTGGVRQNGQAHRTKESAACWTALSRDGKTLYVANFVSNSISAFETHQDGTLRHVRSAARRGAGKPDTKDIVIAKGGKFLYAVASGARQIAVFSLGANREPTELPRGKSPVKLRAGRNLLGLAVD